VGITKNGKLFGCLVFVVITAGFWWGKTDGKKYLGNPGVDGRIILRWIFRNWNLEVWTDSSWLRMGTVGENL
jgi:hypothetical protein